MFRIQYRSNLHLRDKVAFPHIVTPMARYLALTGNIGTPNTQIHASFLDYCTRHWDHVFYVPGMIEFPHIPTLDAMYHNHPRISLLHYNQMSHYVAKEHVAVVGMPFLNLEQERDQFNQLLDYWEFQKTPVCVLTYSDPSKRHTHLFRPNIRAWMYGESTERISKMYGTMPLYASGDSSAWFECRGGEDSGDRPLQEMTAAGIFSDPLL